MSSEHANTKFILMQISVHVTIDPRKFCSIISSKMMMSVIRLHSRHFPLLWRPNICHHLGICLYEWEGGCNSDTFQASVGELEEAPWATAVHLAKDCHQISQFSIKFITGHHHDVICAERLLRPTWMRPAVAHMPFSPSCCRNGILTTRPILSEKRLQMFYESFSYCIGWVISY